MRISNVNPSELKCRQFLTSVMQEVSLHLKKKQKAALKYQDETPAFNIKV